MSDQVPFASGRPAGITVLGSTGSIGMSTLDVIARNPQRYHVVALAAHSDVETIAAQCEQFRPRYAVLADTDAAGRLQQLLHARAPEVEVLGGSQALATVAALDEVDQVMAAIVGAAGLLPALAAARSGKRILLANKEALVMSGELFMREVRSHDALLLPIDSEHNAILQCLPDDYRTGQTPQGVRRVVLTASGGPFRSLPLDQLAGVTPDEACAHPNWSMGRKISVDSATMMNKGLEVIEASWLFAMGHEQIDVLLHPQSVVHSLVEYRDGSVLAQFGCPDMRIPISHALGWPERIESGAGSLDLLAVGNLQFDVPDHGRYPCLQLAAQAMQAGGTAPAVLNAANEVAVQAFLEGRIAFTAIARVIAHTLQDIAVEQAATLDTILAADAQARMHAGEFILERKVSVTQ